MGGVEVVWVGVVEGMGGVEVVGVRVVECMGGVEVVGVGVVEGMGGVEVGVGGDGYLTVESLAVSDVFKHSNRACFSRRWLARKI